MFCHSTYFVQIYFILGIGPKRCVEILAHSGVPYSLDAEASSRRDRAKAKDFDTAHVRGKGLITIMICLSIKENEHKFKSKLWSRNLQPSVSASSLISCVYGI